MHDFLACKVFPAVFSVDLCPQTARTGLRGALSGVHWSVLWRGMPSNFSIVIITPFVVETCLPVIVACNAPLAVKHSNSAVSAPDVRRLRENLVSH